MTTHVKRNESNNFSQQIHLYIRGFLSGLDNFTHSHLFRSSSESLQMLPSKSFVEDCHEPPHLPPCRLIRILSFVSTSQYYPRLFVNVLFRLSLLILGEGMCGMMRE